jgi:hypothetical protein
MWDGASYSELISPSTRDASAATVEEVVACEASASSVKAERDSGDDVEGSSCLSLASSKLYSSSSTKMLSSIFLSPAHSRTSRGQEVVLSNVTSYDSTTVLVSRLNTIRSAMRCITKQNVIKRTRLKFVQIVTLQDKALATKMYEMRDE